MNRRDILVARISQLSDEELKALLRIGSGGSQQINAIAKQEAARRSISIDESELQTADGYNPKEQDYWLKELIYYLSQLL